MAILVTETGGNFSTATWYRAEAYNLDSSVASNALSVDRYTTFSFSNSGNLRGCVVALGNYTQTAVPVGRWARLGIQQGNTATLPVASPGIVTQTSHGYNAALSGVTISNGTSCVVTYVAHGLKEGDWVGFSTTGSLPTGVNSSTRYYVRYIDADTFNISATAKGSLIDTSSSGSGTHSMWVDWVQFTTTGALPTGVTANTIYCVKYIDANTYNLSSTSGGTSINFTGSTSGTHTAWDNKEFSFASTDTIYGTGQEYAQSSCFLIPMIFAGTTAVTTTANGWRWYFSQTDGSGSSIYMHSSSTPSQFFIAWCNTTQAWSSGDNPVECAPTTYDTTTTFTGTQRWYSGNTSVTTSFAGLVCTPSASNRAYSSTGSGNAMFKWDSTSARTLTIDGQILVGTHAGVYVGTENSPLSYTNKATINLTVPPTYSGASANYSGFTDNTNANNYYGGGSTFVFSGDYPTIRYATLTSDASTGQADLVVDDASGFAANDYVYISKHNSVYSASLDATRYQILSIASNTITLTSNVTGQTRLAGGRVILLERGYGVQIYSSSLSNYAVGVVRGHGISNVYMKGVYARGIAQTTGYSINSRFRDNTSNLRSGGWYVGYSVIENYQNAQVNTCSFLATTYGNTYGGTVEHVLGIHCMVVSAFNTYTLTQSGSITSKAGPFTISNCFAMRSSAYVFQTSGVGLSGSVYNANVIHNCLGAITVAQNNTFTNINAYGCQYGIVFYSCYFPVLQDNTIDVCTYAWSQAISGINLIKVRDIRTTITNISTKAFSPLADTYADYDFEDPSYDLSDIDTTYQSQLVQNGEFRVSHNNGTTNNDLVIDANGFRQRCGTGLTDTTVYGSNSYSWRFEPTNQPTQLKYEFFEDIGNQQNQSTFAYVWIKINNANYWAGTHEMPKLIIDYDNGTTATATATQTTNWQQLTVPFTPTTDYPTITFKITGYTDATGSNAYFYYGARNVVLGAGRNYNSGNLDYWSKAKPTVGLSTTISPFDVWTIPTSQLTGSGTVGQFIIKKLLTLAKYIGI